MKVAVVFLLVFISVSYQQQIQRRLWMLPQSNPYYDPYNAAAYYSGAIPKGRNNLPIANGAHLEAEEDHGAMHPSFALDNPNPYGNAHRRNYPYASPNPRFFMNPMLHYPSLDDYEEDYPFYPSLNDEASGMKIYVPPDNDELEVDELEGEIGARKINQLRLNKNRPKFSPGSLTAGNQLNKQRFLFNLFRPYTEIQLQTATTSNNFNFLKTRYIGTIVTATLNLTSVITCVPRDEFSSTSPTACRRRRRGAFHHPGFISSDDEIVASQVNPVEATAMPSARMLGDGQFGDENSFPNLNSAAEPEGTMLNTAEEAARDKRSFFGGIFAVRSTTTYTQYTFLNTTSTKTITLGPSGSSSVLCLPSGYIVC